VPALRHRGADLAGLAATLLGDLAPHRDVRLSQEALRLLGRFSWPGNVRQLSDALAAALTRRPVGAIEAQDLPAFCQSTPRSALRPVDEIERDAIVAALRGADGNRVAAAAALGFARSTLYRKIRQYGITV
jgi:transcriptional regulator of acetoin/glycerol metabolism